MLTNLSIFEFIIAVYMSLYIVKMIIVWPSFKIIIKERIKLGLLTVPEDISLDKYVRTLQVAYALGAGISLFFLLLPTIYKERQKFFKSYSVTDLYHYAQTGSWT